MKTEKGIIIEEQPHLVERLRNALETIQPKIKTALTELKAILKDDFVTSDVKSMLQGKSFVKDRMASKIESPSLGGVILSRSKLSEMIALPDCRNFENAIEQLNEHIKLLMHDSTLRGLLNGKILIDYFQLSKGEIIINENMITLVGENLTTYAKTDKQIEMYNVFKALADAMNSTWKFARNKNIIMQSKFDLIVHDMDGIKWTRDKDKIIVDGDFIKRFAI